MDEKNVKDKIYYLKKSGEKIAMQDGFLIPISFDFENQLPECVKLLSRWRIENPSLSPAKFVITEERTKKWLIKSVLDNKFRVLFFIEDGNGEFIGHIGLSNFDFEKNTIRVDSVMKGKKDCTKGIMEETILCIKEWSKNNFKARNLDLVVLNDNERAIRLYEKCGFERKELIPLRKEVKNNEISWIEDLSLEESELYYLHMITRV